MQQVTVDHAKKHLGDLIEAAVKGDGVVITKENRPVVKLVPVAGTKGQAGSSPRPAIASSPPWPPRKEPRRMSFSVA